MVIFLSLRHNAWSKRRDDLVLGPWFQEVPICGHSAHWTQWQGTMPVTSWWLARESGRNRPPVTWLPPPKPRLPHSMWSLWPNLQDRLRRTFKMWLILSSQCHMRNRAPHTYLHFRAMAPILYSSLHAGDGPRSLVHALSCTSVLPQLYRAFILGHQPTPKHTTKIYY